MCLFLISGPQNLSTELYKCLLSVKGFKLILRFEVILGLERRCFLKFWRQSSL